MSTTTNPQDQPYTYVPASTLSTRALLTPETRTLSSISASSGPFTPNTRSEAEAALSSNAAHQTDAAAPTSPLFPSTGGSGSLEPEGEPHVGTRPPFPTRTSANYINAAGAVAVERETVGGPVAFVGRPKEAVVGETETGEAGGERGRPGDKPRFARQQSWTQRDMRRLMQERLMEGEGDAQGYSSAQAP